MKIYFQKYDFYSKENVHDYDHDLGSAQDIRNDLGGPKSDMDPKLSKTGWAGPLEIPAHTLFMIRWCSLPSDGWKNANV